MANESESIVWLAEGSGRVSGHEDEGEDPV